MRSSSTIRAALLALALLSGPAPLLAQAPPARPDVVIGYVDRADDPWYEVVNGRDGVFRPTRQSARPGAELAIKDGAAMSRALGVSFKLEPLTLRADEPVGPALAALAGKGVGSVLLDLPAGDLREATKATPKDLVLFDIRDRDDALRAETCAAALFHVLPSRGAGTDALAQFLVKRNWKRILVLHGPEPEDKKLAESMQGSARKFGGKIVDVRTFAVSNDPRRREETNVSLLSGGTGDYDVVFIADVMNDVGRTIPYRISLPRPAVGTQGLQAVAWHPFYERNGAPQLNRRYERAAGRQMSEEAYGAWVAVRAIVEATAQAARTGSERPLAQRLLQPDLTLELYKAIPGSFRPWDHSLRQAVLLGTHDAVIDLAPIDGFLHETNVLDTLGLLPNQTPCGTRP